MGLEIIGISSASEIALKANTVYEVSWFLFCNHTVCFGIFMPFVQEKKGKRTFITSEMGKCNCSSMLLGRIGFLVNLEKEFLNWCQILLVLHYSSS